MVELTESYRAMMVATIEGTATEREEKGVAVHDLLNVWLGPDHKREVDDNTMCDDLPAVKKCYDDLVYQGILVTPELNSPEVVAVAGIFTVLHMDIFHSPDHSICCHLFNTNPRIISDIELLLWLYRVVDDCLIDGLAPVQEPEGEKVLPHRRCVGDVCAGLPHRKHP